MPGYWEEEQANEILTIAKSIAARALAGASPFEQPMPQFPATLAATRKLGEVILPATLQQISENNEH
ncbi:hypothetical protein [Scrofimicrobium canadense]|uniref:hypothetical protein n=1 Tax=Scrofimicrobium canadense TaxID=2652290 RepID=UPI001981D45F|nr:hypothetical protein [Scrofimicrobium canadense]